MGFTLIPWHRTPGSMPGEVARGQNLVHIDIEHQYSEVYGMCLFVQHEWRHTLTHTNDLGPRT